MKRIINYSIFYDNQDLVATVEIDEYVDHNYGADADGNRGVSKRFIEDISIKEVWGHCDGFLFQVTPDQKMSDFIKDNLPELL